MSYYAIAISNAPWLRWTHTHTFSTSLSLSIYNILNYTGREAAAAAADSHKDAHIQRLQYCKSAPNTLNYLINTTQLCMQSVHQNMRHYVHAEGLIWVLPYGAVACGMMHLHALPLCFFMYMRWGRVMVIACLLCFLIFLLDVCESPLSSLTSWIYLLHSLSPFSFQASLPLWPQTSTLVTPRSLYRWKICFRVSYSGPSLICVTSFSSTLRIKKCLHVKIKLKYLPSDSAKRKSVTLKPPKRPTINET